MEYRLILDPNAAESVVVTARERSPLTEAIEALVTQPPEEFLTGYRNGEGFRLNPEEIICIVTEDDRVFALTQKEKLLLKERLCRIEPLLPGYFIRINRSVLANLRAVRRFDTSVAGTLKVTFRNGYQDYVSRRNLKQVKKALGV